MNHMNDSVRETLSFMDELRRTERLENEINEINELPEIKYRKLEDTKKKAVTMCMDNIFHKVYRDSIPCDISGIKTSDNVKDLDVELRKYIANRTGGQDSQYYVKEGLKKSKNPVLKRVLESVENMISELYWEQTVNPERITDEDLGFEITPEIDDKLNEVIRDNNLDDLTDLIKTNVKNTTINEIMSAKQEKEERMQLEEELKNDESIKTEAALQEALAERGYYHENSDIYEPSLFTAILMNKFSKIQESHEEIIPESMDYYSEGLFSGISEMIKLKREANAKAAITNYSVSMRRWLDRVYRKVYSTYRSDIVTVDFDKLIKNLKKAVADTDRDINKISITMPNIQKIKEDRAAQDKMNLWVLEHPKAKPDRREIVLYGISTPFGTACDDVVKYIKDLDSYFKTTKLDVFIDKFMALAHRYADNAATEKEVLNIFDAVSYIAINEINNIFVTIYAANLFQRTSKDVVYRMSSQALKESVYAEAVRELTLINLSTALQLEDGNPLAIKKLANDYATGNIN